MNRIGTFRNVLAGMLAGAVSLTAASLMTTSTFALEPDGYYCHDTFENGTDNWEGRGGAAVSVSDNAYSGSQALAVSGRSSAWHGAMKTLDDTVFRAGVEYSFSIAAAGSGNMMLSLQYTDASGKTAYDHIADGVSSGEYVLLTNTNYKLPEGSGYVLYVETGSGTDSFSIDEAIIAKAGTQIRAETAVNAIQGDLNGDERIDAFDLVFARKALLARSSAGTSMPTVLRLAMNWSHCATVIGTSASR